MGDGLIFTTSNQTCGVKTKTLTHSETMGKMTGTAYRDNNTDSCFPGFRNPMGNPDYAVNATMNVPRLPHIDVYRF
jgi:hypothetical protein